MEMHIRGLGAMFLILGTTPAIADPGDYREDYAEKHWELRADCNEKLEDAEDRWEFRKVTDECDREFAKLRREMRYVAEKERRDANKEWRQHSRNADDDWDD